jgi:hypothetical protein
MGEKSGHGLMVMPVVALRIGTRSTEAVSSNS